MAAPEGSDSMSRTTRTLKVSNLSPKATKNDIHDFFSFSGEIEHIELQSDGDEPNIAFVTFKEPQALDTAVLLSGATIVDQMVTITEVDNYHHNPNDDSTKQSLPAGEGSAVLNAVFKAQDVMTSMLAKGYILGKDAMDKAKTFDEKHQLSANATATVSSLDKKFGLTQTFSSGTAAVNEHVRVLDEKYQVSEKTRSTFLAAEQRVGSAASALLNNKYIFTSAAWVTGAFNKVTKAAGDVSQKAFGDGSGAKE